MRMKGWLKDIINLIYPVQCHICGNPLASHEKFLCSHCLQSLPRTGYHRNPGNPMEQKLAGFVPFKSATGHFFYSRDSSLAQLIQDMKYRGFHELGVFLGQEAGAELYTSGFLSDIDIIVPVPMHYLKKAGRGYNQSDKISEGISKATGLPWQDALRMTRSRKTQTSLSGSQRLRNAENLFQVRKGINLESKNILVVDDICTTGTTIGAAAKALKDAFPSASIYYFALGIAF